MRKKSFAFAGLICVSIAVWLVFLRRGSTDNVQLQFLHTATTNLNGRTFELIRVSNEGGQTIIWSSASLPWECRAETPTRWTNVSEGHMTGGDWLRPGEAREFRVELPEGTRSWKVGLKFDVASPKQKLGIKLHTLKVPTSVLNLFWRYVPDARSQDADAWSAVFTNAWDPSGAL
jgi:hypothetical protein